MKTETVRPETGAKPEKAQEQKSAEPRQITTAETP